MKRKAVRDYLLTLAQVPLVLIELVVAEGMLLLALVENRLARLRSALQEVTSIKPTRKAQERSPLGNTCQQTQPKPQTCEPQHADEEQGDKLAELFALIESGDDAGIDELRKYLESTLEGREIADEYRRLYAVAQPSKKDNLLRIELLAFRLGHVGIGKLLAARSC